MKQGTLGMTGEKSLKLTRRQFVAASAFIAGAASPIAVVGNHTLSQSQQKPSSRVIIDTDPGVDDAFALLLAMRSPEMKIEAITTVAGNVPLELTLPNALRMVEIAGRSDIPVSAGAKAPLLRRSVSAAYVHGENGLAGAEFPEPKMEPTPEPAAALIRQIIRKYPGEVTVITLGPQTNLATALNADPGLASAVRGVVMMAGSLSGGNITPAAEFNVYVDPEAARIVFQSGIPITMVGLDVTRRASLTDAHVRALEAAQNPVSQAAAKIARHAIDHARDQGFMVDPNMHDSLAVAAFLDPSLLKWKEYYIDVETAGELTAGETLGYSPSAGDLRRTSAAEKQAAANYHIRGSAPTLGTASTSSLLRDKYVPNANVAIDVDSARFFDLLIGRLTKAQQ